MDDNGEHLIQLPAINDEAAFEKVFKTYFKNLHAYACTIIKEEAASEEIVQQVFVKLWERSESLNVSGSEGAASFLGQNPRRCISDKMNSSFEVCLILS